MAKAKVTILTSVYNTSPYLRRCFDSFKNQTFKDVEFLICNNASTDNSQEIIDEYVNSDSRFHTFKLDKNAGPSGAWALAMQKVDTEYFGICDSDDYIAENYVEVLYNKIKEYDADISMCTNDLVWDDGTTKINPRPGKSELVFTDKDIPNLLPQVIDMYSDEYLGYNLYEVGVVWSRIYKTSFIRENNLLYDKNLWIFTDWMFNFSVIKHMKKLVYTEETLYHYYQSDNSITRSKKINKNEKEYIRRATEYLARESKDCMSDKLAKAMYNFYNLCIFRIRHNYISGYPEQVTKKEVSDVFKEISGWDCFKYLEENSRYAKNFKQKLHLFNIKHNILWPYFLKESLKRMINK